MIECLIAGTVMALFAASIVVAAGQSAAATGRGADRRAAAQHLDAVLNKIDILGPARLAVEGPFSGDLTSDADDPGGSDARAWSWSATIAPEGVWPDLYAVDVTVNWTDPSGRPRALTTRTRLFDPVGSRNARVRWEDL